MGKAETASRNKTEFRRGREAADSGAADTRQQCGGQGGESSPEPRSFGAGGGTRAVFFHSAPYRGAAAVLLGIFLIAGPCGCGAARHLASANGVIVVKRDCMISVELTEKTECIGHDVEHLHCTGLLLTKKTGCETLRIER